MPPQPAKPATGANPEFSSSLLTKQTDSIRVGKVERSGSLADIPAYAIALKEAGEQSHRIGENHNADED